jgi:hypothetical protein
VFRAPAQWVAYDSENRPITTTYHNVNNKHHRLAGDKDFCGVSIYNFDLEGNVTGKRIVSGVGSCWVPVHDQWTGPTHAEEFPGVYPTQPLVKPTRPEV